jgi:type II secretory pathway pseudopilin PulG
MNEPVVRPSVKRRPRRGFLLPFVLLALLLVAAISGAAGLGAWRAMRAARLAWNGERAAQAADEALALAVSDWDAEQFAASAIGAPWPRTILTADGVAVDVVSVRTGPLSAVLEATARSRVSGSPDTASRRVARALSLQTLRLPVHAALTALGTAGTLEITGAADIDGRDMLAARDGCAPERDSASVPGVYAGSVSVARGASVQGSVTVVAPGLASVELADQRTSFDAAWSTAADRVLRRQAIGVAGQLAVSRPWSALHVTANDTAGRQVLLTGTSSHEGVLLVDGDLVVRGTLRLRGLLAVRGALDVTDGRVDVEGAVVVRDGAAHGAAVGDGVRIRYSGCSVRRAMAAIARPAFSPYGVWVAR